MGPVDTSLRQAKGKPTGIMVVGLQGSGKTTTAAKLAGYLKKTQSKRPMLVAADIYRPAAVEQLQVLGKKLGIPVFNEPGVAPPEMCRHALAEAAKHKNDVVHLRHRRPPGDRRADDGRARAGQEHRPAREHPAGLRRDDRPGRGPDGRRVQPAAGARRLHPDQARRRRPRRRGALDQGDHRQAHQVRRHGRGARQARGVPARRARQPHPGLRRHRRADEGLRGRRRRGQGGGRRQEDPLRQVPPRRLRRADQARQEDGPDLGADGALPALRRHARGLLLRRQGARPHPGHGRLDDRGRAAGSRSSSHRHGSSASRSARAARSRRSRGCWRSTGRCGR